MAVTIKTLTEDTVTIVAENVTSGNITRHRYKGRDMSYIATTRATGAAAPSRAVMKDEGFLMFQFHPEQEIIDNDTAIDIYVLCSDGKSDDNIGKLVVTT